MFFGACETNVLIYTKICRLCIFMKLEVIKKIEATQILLETAKKYWHMYVQPRNIGSDLNQMKYDH